MSLRNRTRSSGPTSLRTQLLSRSLIILALLLVLIGALQYVLMKNALFRNQAEALSLQARSIPMELWEADQEPHNRPSGRNNEALPENPRKGDRPMFFLPNMSLSKIETDGGYTDLAADNGLSAPKLTAEVYSAILEKFQKRMPIPYEVIDNAEGTEQIIVFRPYGNPSSPSGVLQLGLDTQPLHAVLLRQLLILPYWLYWPWLQGLHCTCLCCAERSTPEPNGRSGKTHRRRELGGAFSCRAGSTGD